MFLNFFTELRGGGVPVSLKEYLTLIEALSEGKTSSGINNRVQFIQKTGEMIAEKPLLGHGIGIGQVAGHRVQAGGLCLHGTARKFERIKQRHDPTPL